MTVYVIYCNVPTSYKFTHAPLCGQPAVARLKMGTKLPDIVACEKHQKKMGPHLPWEKV